MTSFGIEGPSSNKTAELQVPIDRPMSSPVLTATEVADLDCVSYHRGMWLAGG
jgi:hypothetical protein